MATLGTAYVQIVPSAQGISGKIQKVLQPEATNAGTSAGKTIAAKIGDGLTSVGGTITNKVTKPVLAAGTALAGLTLVKGWSRMVEIDNARAKLQALGQDAKAVQESANEAVKGTSYSLNKAMTTAASAVAAGIKPGEQLTRYLKNISDASAVAGIDMDEMGAIFNKVATNGKMSAEELNQLSDRGIPAMQLLAEATGKSMDEVREAISNGEIGIEELQKAIELGMDGAAKSIGSSTITGAISNLNAAIGRIGANILGSSDDENSIAGRILPMLNAMMTALEPLEEKAKGLGQSIANHIGPAIDRITNMLSGGTTMAEAAQAMADRTTAKFVAFGTGIASALGPVLVIVGKGISVFLLLKDKIAILAQAMGTSSGAILRMAGIVGLIVSAFVIAYTKSESFRNAINQLASIIGGALMQVFQALQPMLSAAMTLFAQLAVAAGNLLGPIIEAMIPIFQRYINIIVSVVTTMARFSTSIITAISNIGSLPEKVSSIFEGIRSAIQEKIDLAKTKVSSVVGTIKSYLSFKGLVSVVKATFDSLREKMTEPIDKARDKITRIIDKIKGKFPFNIGRIIKMNTPSISLKTGSKSVLGKTITYPKGFDISWNAKAMDNPYLFSNATLFGAGEAGDEILYGKRSLMEDIRDAVGGQQQPVTITNYITVDGAEDPDAWTERFAHRLKMEMRTA